MKMAKMENMIGKCTEEDFTINWIFNAPRELVFKAWTEPERLMKWWGPRGFSTPVAKIDLRPGGKYYNCMRSPEGRDFCSTGVFREVKAPERLVYTDSFADHKGDPVSPSLYGMDPAWPQEVLTDVTFTELGGMTRISVHSAVPRSLAERQMAPQGWAESMVKLAEYLEKC
jgi:uncharacterized protein YndB with AHSA1/START domain